MNPALFGTDALKKPSTGSRKRGLFTRKEKRRISRDRDKRKAKIEASARLKAIRIACFQRDHGRCRAYGVPVKLESDNPFTLAHCHHIVYRSAGGSDELFNRCILSPKAHEEEHAGQLEIAGDPNSILWFTLKDKETGRVMRAWESAV